MDNIEIRETELTMEERRIFEGGLAGILKTIPHNNLRKVYSRMPTGQGEVYVLNVFYDTEVDEKPFYCEASLVLTYDDIKEQATLNTDIKMTPKRPHT
jgi:hypothetical protein